MATDFFESQDAARRSTGRLVILFGLAVIAIALTVYALAVGLVGYHGQDRTGAMGRLMALVESYPDLKANTNMMQLSEELTSTENKVSFSRQAFNDSVMVYNTYKQSFPAVSLAGMFGHTQDATPLEFDSEAIAEAPKVSF